MIGFDSFFELTSIAVIGLLILISLLFSFGIFILDFRRNNKFLDSHESSINDLKFYDIFANIVKVFVSVINSILRRDIGGLIPLIEGGMDERKGEGTNMQSIIIARILVSIPVLFILLFSIGLVVQPLAEHLPEADNWKHMGLKDLLWKNEIKTVEKLEAVDSLRMYELRNKRSSLPFSIIRKAFGSDSVRMDNVLGSVLPQVGDLYQIKEGLQVALFYEVFYKKIEKSGPPRLCDIEQFYYLALNRIASQASVPNKIRSQAASKSKNVDNRDLSHALIDQYVQLKQVATISSVVMLSALIVIFFSVISFCKNVIMALTTCIDIDIKNKILSSHIFILTILVSGILMQGAVRWLDIPGWTYISMWVITIILYILRAWLIASFDHDDTTLDFYSQLMSLRPGNVVSYSEIRALKEKYDKDRQDNEQRLDSLRGFKLRAPGFLLGLPITLTVIAFSAYAYRVAGISWLESTRNKIYIVYDGINSIEPDFADNVFHK